MLYRATMCVTNHSRQQFQSCSRRRPAVCNGVHVKDVNSCSPTVTAGALHEVADWQPQHTTTVCLAVCQHSEL